MSYDPAAKAVDGTGIVTTSFLTPMFTPTTGNPVYLTLAQLQTLLGLSGGGSGASPATTYTITTASTGTAGTAQAVTVATVGALSSAVVVTLSDGASGTFSGTVTLPAGTNSSGAAQYTPATAGTRAIMGTNNGGLTNPSGSSVTVAASGGGTSGPNATALTTTSPTYAYRNGTSGQKMLTGGTASGAVKLPENAFVIKIQIKMQATGVIDNSANEIVGITDANGNHVAIGFFGTSLCALSSAGRADPTGASYADGAVHEAALVVENGYCHAYMDGTRVAERFLGYVDFNPSAGACTINVGCGTQGQGEYDIRAYSGSLTSLGGLIAEWQLDNSGALS